MDQESSWVGLGWSFNPGVINREVRGFPDEFKDETIDREFNLRDNYTVGGSRSVGFPELFGIQLLDFEASAGGYYNNYRGFGANFNLGVTASFNWLYGNGVGLGLGYDTGAGLDFTVTPKLGLTNHEQDVWSRLSFTTGFNSRQGLKELSFDLSHAKGVSLESKIGGEQYIAAVINSENSVVGGAISFSGFTYTPTSPFPFKNEAYNLSLGAGPTFIGASVFLNQSGYFTRQFLATNTLQQRAYGYLNHQYINDATEEGRASLMDYNKSRGFIHRDSPVIPAAFGTYDLFNVSGQGIGGQYRAHRRDLGVFRSGYSSNKSISAALGIELAGGNLVDAEPNFIGAEANSSKGAWAQRNRLQSTLGFLESEDVREAVFFGTPGGNPRTDQETTFLEDNLGGDDPIRTKLKQNANQWPVTALSEFLVGDETIGVADRTDIDVAQGDNQLLGSRQRRNQVMSYLTAGEASIHGLERDIEDAGNAIPRTSYPDHHMSEVTVTQPDGRRYIYGIPAYNHRQDEISFSVSQNSYDIDAPREVSYETADRSIANSKGRDNFYDRTTTPAYPHSFLLTAILSPDYVDWEGDGITDDDSGAAVELRYKRAHGDYRWRTPFAGASYAPGNHTDDLDDKANFIYGEKDIWYVDQIIGRTSVAVFHTSDRCDGLGVINEDGGKDETKKLQKLDRIDIYSKSEWLGENPVPIKSIHFDYDYTLCEGVPNATNTCSENGTGKLTLKKVFFTYEDSDRGALNAYKFNYRFADEEGDTSVPYNLDKVNRWGLYQDNAAANLPANSIFPYALQDEAIAATQVGAWNLDEIQLPSGGKINVEYEADDYAYVQDKRAGQMFKLLGFASEVNGETSDELYSATGTTNSWMVVDIADYLEVGDEEEPVTEAEVRARFLEDVEQIYFRTRLDLTGEETWEDISGYLQYDDAQVDINIAQGRLYIPVQNVEAENIDNVHPIAFAGIQFTRLERPALAYPGYDLSPDDQPGLPEGLGLIRELGNVFKGFVRNGISNGWSRRADLSRSWIRLANPDLSKIGGGTRVKAIRLSDEWTQLGQQASVYGQTYTYYKEVDIAGQKRTVSSGVAAYEPLVGGEENLLRHAIEFDEKRALAPNSSYYIEGPIGETLYPSPMVGYSEVRVQPLEYEGVEKGLGYTLNEFYTAKDFPVVERRTGVDMRREKPDAILSWLRLYNKDEMVLSQGLSVEVNDMHGKMRATTVYNGAGAILQSTVYTYRTVEDEGTVAARESALHLRNDVSLMKADGSIVPGEIGKTVDVWQEMEHDRSSSLSVGIGVSNIAFLIAIFPALAPIPLPYYSKEDIAVKTATTTKFIQRFGILDKVTVMENGSTLTTENLLYDAETGNVLLTETQNEFDDAMFSFTYPAHLAYDGMGQAYENTGAVIELSDIDPSAGPFVIPSSAEQFFNVGDEVSISIPATTSPDNDRHWVMQNATDLILIDKNGTPFSTFIHDTSEGVLLKILRSGKRNQSQTPIASISARQDLGFDNGQIVANTGQEILAASAAAFGQDWQMRCEEYDGQFGSPSYDVDREINPYVEGLAGNWRLNETYSYFSLRDNVTFGGATINNSIRDRGNLNVFTPFWIFGGDGLIPNPASDDNWTEASEMTVYDQHGSVLEVKDALGIYSASQLGYNENLTVAVASNARSQEMYFDGFEDYSFTDGETTLERPFRKLNIDDSSNPNLIQPGPAHTGNYALTLDPSENLTLTLQQPCVDAVALRARSSSTAQVHRGEQSGKDSDITLLKTAEEEEEDCTPYVNDSAKGVFQNTCCSCLPALNPQVNQRYHLSLWVATGNSLDCGAVPLGAELTASVYDFSNTLITDYDILIAGPVIEGWQRYELSLDALPSNFASLDISFTNLGTDGVLYLDDFRFHPFQSNMMSYVYDSGSLRLWATLDENNYATFYEYDDEGLLIRTKRETEAGIMTVQESRTVLTSNN
ncbi:MAG: hypothetical protein AAFZ63_27170 [Bacteroidota bacterium]